MADQQIQKKHIKREGSSVTISEDCGVSRNEPIILQDGTTGTQISEQYQKRSARQKAVSQVTNKSKEYSKLKDGDAEARNNRQYTTTELMHSHESVLPPAQRQHMPFYDPIKTNSRTNSKCSPIPSPRD